MVTFFNETGGDYFRERLSSGFGKNGLIRNLVKGVRGSQYRPWIGEESTDIRSKDLSQIPIIKIQIKRGYTGIVSLFSLPHG